MCLTSVWLLLPFNTKIIYQSSQGHHSIPFITLSLPITDKPCSRCPIFRRRCSRVRHEHLLTPSSASSSFEAAPLKGPPPLGRAAAPFSARASSLPSPRFPSHPPYQIWGIDVNWTTTEASALWYYGYIRQSVLVSQFWIVFCLLFYNVCFWYLLEQEC